MTIQKKHHIPQNTSDNILIEISKDKWKPVKGSLRFNYMFPIPDECIK